MAAGTSCKDIQMLQSSKFAHAHPWHKKLLKVICKVEAILKLAEEFNLGVSPFLQGRTMMTHKPMQAVCNFWNSLQILIAICQAVGAENRRRVR